MQTKKTVRLQSCSRGPDHFSESNFKFQMFSNDILSYPNIQAGSSGSLINPTRVKYFSAKNYSADFSETRGIDWTLLGASNEGTAHARFVREHAKLKKSRTF